MIYRNQTWREQTEIPTSPGFYYGRATKPNKQVGIVPILIEVSGPSLFVRTWQAGGVEIFLPIEDFQWFGAVDECFELVMDRPEILK
jgi:hypothetical protein